MHHDLAQTEQLDDVLEVFDVPRGQVRAGQHVDLARAPAGNRARLIGRHLARALLDAGARGEANLLDLAGNLHSVVDDRSPAEKLAEYKAAKERQSFLEARIAQLHRRRHQSLQSAYSPGEVNIQGPGSRHRSGECGSFLDEHRGSSR